MIGKYFEGAVPSEVVDGERLVIDDVDWPTSCADAVTQSIDSMESFDLAGSIAAALALVRRVDGFINATQPFKLAKDETKRDELGAILYQCAETVRIASLLLAGVCPGKTAELWAALGQDIDPARGDLLALAEWGGLKPGTHVEKVALFPRVEMVAEAEV